MAKKKPEQDEPLEKKLWKAADKLRKNMDAAEYKHVVLGLIFLKYISDAFEELFQKLTAEKSEGADPEDKNEYIAEKVFYVPPSARWTWLQGRAKLPSIGKDIDDAMDAIERDNPQSLKGVLPKVYAQEKLDKASLGGLIDLISTSVLGTKEARSKDLLGRVFEYFLGEFALAEGKKGGQFYTPESVVKLLVEMLEPYEGRVFDPCCGSGGMFVQSEKFIKRHQDHYKKANGKKLSLNPADLISIYGQESNQTTWRLARMNLAIRGIDSTNVKWNNEGSFLNDAHKDLKADYIIANPPFNDSDWSGELLQKDARWQYGLPPAGNANYAWIQHFLYHLAPTGKAGFVLSKGSLTTNTTGEGEIRKALVENDLIDCVVNLPAKLFLNTQIPACLWFLSRNKQQHKKKILFIDARNLGFLINRRTKELSDDDIQKVASTYHNWRTGGNKESIKRLKNLDPPIDENTENLRPLLEAIEKRIGEYIQLNSSSPTYLFVSNLTREHLRKTISFFLSVSSDQTPVPFQEVGTGTLNTLVLALLSLVAEMKSEVVFAMEEPEIALPPHTQRRIANYLLTKTTQCFVTSHSPYIIEMFDPGQVQILKRDESGTLTTSNIVINDKSIKLKNYRKHSRRGLCEVMLGKGVVIVEGITEQFVFWSVAKKMEESKDEFYPLDLSGVTIFSNDGDGSMPDFGVFFKSIDLRTYGFYDKKERSEEINNKLKSSFDFNYEIAYKGIETMLINETPIARQWQLVKLINNEKGDSRIPTEKPTDEEIKSIALKILKGAKGDGTAARLIDLCSFAELPKSITNFLKTVYADFPRPASTPLPKFEKTEGQQSLGL